jgi:hypothetical protein
MARPRLIKPVIAGFYLALMALIMIIACMTWQHVACARRQSPEGMVSASQSGEPDSESSDKWQRKALCFLMGGVAGRSAYASMLQPVSAAHDQGRNKFHPD